MQIINVYVHGDIPDSAINLLENELERCANNFVENYNAIVKSMENSPQVKEWAEKNGITEKLSSD